MLLSAGLNMSSGALDRLAANPSYQNGGEIPDGARRRVPHLGRLPDADAITTVSGHASYALDLGGSGG